MIARAALVDDVDVFCLLRKRKRRNLAITSCLPIPYVEPVGYFEMIRFWGLEEILFHAPPYVVRAIIQCVPHLREIRVKITVGAARDSRDLRAREYCVDRAGFSLSPVSAWVNS